MLKLKLMPRLSQNWQIIKQVDPTVVVKLKELDLALKRQEHDTQLLHLRALEIQVHRDIQLRKLDLEAQALQNKPVPLHRSRPSSSSVPDVSQSEFDVGRCVKLVLPFREAEVDSYFVAFERVAAKLNWPKDMWALLLQCIFVGKAQEVCSALSIEDSLDYDTVKAAVLRAYELVPEAYRQRFRSCSTLAKQTFVEFAREKKNCFFEKWCMQGLEILQHKFLKLLKSCGFNF